MKMISKFLNDNRRVVGELSILWMLVSTSAVLFAGLTTLLVMFGVNEEKSLLASFAAISACSLVTLLTIYTRGLFSEAYWRQRRPQNYYSSHLYRLYKRAYFTFAGASHADVAVDVLRILGILGLIYVGLNQRLISLLAHGGMTRAIFFGSTFLITFHTLIYPLLRKQTLGDLGYKYRKVLMTTAINYAASAAITGNYRAAVKEIELNITRAVKSYLDYITGDKGKNLTVNLIIRHPSDQTKLVCIQRTDSKRQTPKIYAAKFMPTSMKVLKENRPVYVGNFISVLNPPKPYKTVWQVPINVPVEDQIKTIGILAIDSLRRDHLTLEDDRETLLFNLMPYIAMLRESLLFRIVHGIWDDVEHLDGAQVDLIPNATLKKYKKQLDQTAHVDRNLDKESLEAIFERGSIEQYKELKRIIDSVQESPARRFFGVIFPLVETNNRRVRG